MRTLPGRFDVPPVAKLARSFAWANLHADTFAHAGRVVARVSDWFSPAHPLHDSIVSVAWLHDVVEDTDVTFADLEEAGFSETIVDAVSILTRRESESYADYIWRVASPTPARHAWDLALLVKWADLSDNRTRLPVKPSLFARYGGVPAR